MIEQEINWRTLNNGDLFYFSVMTVEVDLREIKELLFSLNRKIDMLIGDRETLALMMLSEKSEFLEGEPDVYSVNYIRVKYR
ncbi:MAG: hypothetical protein ACP5PQ_02910 [Thermoproteota archaeon]